MQENKGNTWSTRQVANSLAGVKLQRNITPKQWDWELLKATPMEKSTKPLGCTQCLQSGFLPPSQWSSMGKRPCQWVTGWLVSPKPAFNDFPYVVSHSVTLDTLYQMPILFTLNGECIWWTQLYRFFWVPPNFQYLWICLGGQFNHTSGSRLRLSTLRVSWEWVSHLSTLRWNASLCCVQGPCSLTLRLASSALCSLSLRQNALHPWMMEVTSAKILGGRWEDLTWVHLKVFVSGREAKGAPAWLCDSP